MAQPLKLEVFETPDLPGKPELEDPRQMRSADELLDAFCERLLFYMKIGIHSSAVLFGRADVAVTMACYAVHLAVLAAIGARIGAGWAFYVGLVAAAAIAVYHYRLIRSRERSGCFRAFLHNQWLGFAVFAGVVGDFALR